MENKTNVFISFSFDQSSDWKNKIELKLEESDFAVNYSEKVDKSHLSDETIWNDLKNRISGSSVMLVLYSQDLEHGSGGKACKIADNRMHENDDFKKQGWIYKEIRAGLRESKNNAINGIGVIMDDINHARLYSNQLCNKDKTKTTNLNRNLYPNILEKNYGNKKTDKWTPNCGCCFNIIADSFIPIIKESDFNSNPKHYIELLKRRRDDIDNFNIVKVV